MREASARRAASSIASLSAWMWTISKAARIFPNWQRRLSTVRHISFTPLTATGRKSLATVSSFPFIGGFPPRNMSLSPVTLRGRSASTVSTLPPTSRPASCIGHRLPRMASIYFSITREIPAMRMRFLANTMIGTMPRRGLRARRRR